MLLQTYLLLFSNSVVSDSLRPHRLHFPVLHYLLELFKLMSVIPSNHLILCPLSSCPQSFPASGSFPMSQFFISGGQSNWSFSFSISPSNEYSGLISFRIDWFELIAVHILHAPRPAKAVLLRTPFPPRPCPNLGTSSFRPARATWAGGRAEAGSAGPRWSKAEAGWEGRTAACSGAAALSRKGVAGQVGA